MDWYPGTLFFKATDLLFGLFWRPWGTAIFPIIFIHASLIVVVQFERKNHRSSRHSIATITHESTSDPAYSTVEDELFDSLLNGNCQSTVLRHLVSRSPLHRPNTLWKISGKPIKKNQTSHIQPHSSNLPPCPSHHVPTSFQAHADSHRLPPAQQHFPSSNLP